MAVQALPSDQVAVPNPLAGLAMLPPWTGTRAPAVSPGPSNAAESTASRSTMSSAVRSASTSQSFHESSQGGGASSTLPGALVFESGRSCHDHITMRGEGLLDGGTRTGPSERGGGQEPPSEAVISKEASEDPISSVPAAVVDSGRPVCWRTLYRDQARFIREMMCPRCEEVWQGMANPEVTSQHLIAEKGP